MLADIVAARVGGGVGLGVVVASEGPAGGEYRLCLRGEPHGLCGNKGKLFTSLWGCGELAFWRFLLNFAGHEVDREGALRVYLAFGEGGPVVRALSALDNIFVVKQSICETIMLKFSIFELAKDTGLDY